MHLKKKGGKSSNRKKTYMHRSWSNACNTAFIQVLQIERPKGCSPVLQWWSLVSYIDLVNQCIYQFLETSAWSWKEKKNKKQAYSTEHNAKGFQSCAIKAQESTGFCPTNTIAADFTDYSFKLSHRAWGLSACAFSSIFKYIYNIDFFLVT